MSEINNELLHDELQQDIVNLSSSVRGTNRGYIAKATDFDNFHGDSDVILYKVIANELSRIEEKASKLSTKLKSSIANQLQDLRGDLGRGENLDLDNNLLDDIPFSDINYFLGENGEILISGIKDVEKMKNEKGYTFQKDGKVGFIYAGKINMIGDIDSFGELKKGFKYEKNDKWSYITFEGKDYPESLGHITNIEEMESGILFHVHPTARVTYGDYYLALSTGKGTMGFGFREQGDFVHFYRDDKREKESKMPIK